jgi:hypothetical protein
MSNYDNSRGHKDMDGQMNRLSGWIQDIKQELDDLKKAIIDEPDAVWSDVWDTNIQLQNIYNKVKDEVKVYLGGA